jgi:hypothetical protein
MCIAMHAANALALQMRALHRSLAASYRTEQQMQFTQMQCKQLSLSHKLAVRLLLLLPTRLQEKEQQQQQQQQQQQADDADAAADEAEDISEGGSDGEFEEGESSDGEPANTDIFEAELKEREEQLGKHCMVVGTLDGEPHYDKRLGVVIMGGIFLCSMVERGHTAAAAVGHAAAAAAAV